MARTREHEYTKTHPWLSFKLKMRQSDPELWALLGEARSKIEHLRGSLLQPTVAHQMNQLYLAKGALATTAIEGNTLSEEDALKRVSGELKLPPSQEYLGVEIDNIVAAWNKIEAEVLAAGGHRPLTVDAIEEFNRLVLADLDLERDVVPGEIRSHSVVIARYRGAPADDCEYLLQRLCEWLESSDFDAPADEWGLPYATIKAVVAHLYLAWIHPFGDGNGRTARLVENQILLGAGVPQPATHLLSNHYNQTRADYYRQLEAASESADGLQSFLRYAVRGFVDGLREQLRLIRNQQWDDRWEQYVYQSFGHTTSPADLRRRQLVLDLSKRSEPVPKMQLPNVSPEVARAYANKGVKTLTRDVNDLRARDLIRRVPGGFVPKRELILAFLPPSTNGAQPQQS